MERSPEKRKPSLPSPRILGAKDNKPLIDHKAVFTKFSKDLSPKMSKARSAAGHLSPKGNQVCEVISGRCMYICVENPNLI